MHMPPSYPALFLHDSREELITTHIPIGNSINFRLSTILSLKGKFRTFIGMITSFNFFNFLFSTRCAFPIVAFYSVFSWVDWPDSIWFQSCTFSCEAMYCSRLQAQKPTAWLHYYLALWPGASVHLGLCFLGLGQCAYDLALAAAEVVTCSAVMAASWCCSCGRFQHSS